MDDYLAGRWVNEPFRIFDCASEVDGAGAFLIASEAWLASVPPAAGLAGGFGRPTAGSDGRNGTTRPRCTRRSRPRVCGAHGPEAGRHGLRLHLRLLHLHRHGHDRGLRLLQEGPGRRLLPGRSGHLRRRRGDQPARGLLSEGYIHGLNHHFEAALQLRGQAGCAKSPTPSSHWSPPVPAPSAAPASSRRSSRERFHARRTAAAAPRRRHRGLLAGDRAVELASVPLPSVPALAASAGRAVPASPATRPASSRSAARAPCSASSSPTADRSLATRSSRPTSWPWSSSMSSRGCASRHASPASTCTRSRSACACRPKSKLSPGGTTTSPSSAPAAATSEPDHSHLIRGRCQTSAGTLPLVMSPRTCREGRGTPGARASSARSWSVPVGIATKCVAPMPDKRAAVR